MLILTVTNVDGLTKSVEQRTQNYLRDVSEQSAQVVEERFAGRFSMLRVMGNTLAYSMVRGDEAAFLSTKLPLSEFDALGYIRVDGSGLLVSDEGTTSVSHVMQEYADSSIWQEALRGETTAAFYDDNVAFLEPISPDEMDPTDGDILGIMIGIRSADSLQDLLVNDAFGGSGFTFIVDQNGTILAEPMDEASYAALEQLVKDVMSGAPSAVQTGLEALQANPNSSSGPVSGEYTLSMPNGATLLLDFQPLEMFDWNVVSAVNENFLAESVNNYVVRIVSTLSVFMGIFAVLLLVLIVMQSRYQKRLEGVAFVDPLTGGTSFIRFRMLAEPLIQKGHKDDYALATLNVKRFKLINRVGGSREGDDLLRHIYDIIQRNLIGPDEMGVHSTADNFVMLLRNEGEDRLRHRLQKIQEEVEALQSVMPVRVGQGVYVIADRDIDLIMFLDRANIARISAPDDYHSSLVFYDDTFVEKQEERLRMIAMIEDGLTNNEFTVYLQPKVSPVTHKMLGSEALVRWIHPTRGMIGPNVFIPLCEQNGLICDLDLYVFDKVCAQIREWQDKGWNPTPISVNVSGLHLKDPNFVKGYREIADKHGVDPSMIELELTESIMFSDLETTEARRVIDQIHEHGFKCSMDDFGSGYSALGVLSELPIDCIKLDRSFFIDCIGNERAQTVIATAIKLAQDLNTTTVAEGIETEEQVEMLKAMGCDMIQGFYFSRPLPLGEFADIAFIQGATLPIKKDDEDEKKGGKS